MKRTRRILLVFAVVMSCGIYSASAQIYVNVQPPRPPVHVRIAAPTPQHVWIEEDWQQRNGKYEANGGRWAQPPHRGDKYKSGHWRQSKRGHSWKEGRWHSGRRRK
ncbi:MAG: hypothetical protein K0Q79_3599 [Flavipsychrobacter sp.]|nr:hypothetical protein [Flavipsychrobacter sp.]